MTTDVMGILRGTDLLASVPAEDLRPAAATSRVRSFRRGQIVFIKSNPSDAVIVVISGHVKMVFRSADGGELTLAVIGAGGVFGELGVADNGPRSANAGPWRNASYCWSRVKRSKTSARAPAAAMALASAIAAALRRLTEVTADLVFLDLPPRVAKLLLSQPRGDDGVIRQESRR